MFPSRRAASRARALNTIPSVIIPTKSIFHRLISPNTSSRPLLIARMTILSELATLIDPCLLCGLIDFQRRFLRGAALLLVRWLVEAPSVRKRSGVVGSVLSRRFIAGYERTRPVQVYCSVCVALVREWREFVTFAGM